LSVEPSLQHVGQQNTSGFHIEGGDEPAASIAHPVSSKCLAAAEQLAIDLADLFQYLANSLVIVEELLGLCVILLGHVVHLGVHIGITYRQVVFGAVPTALGALATGLATPFVALDQGTAEDGGQGWQLAQERLTALAQHGRGLYGHLYQTI